MARSPPDELQYFNKATDTTDNQRRAEDIQVLVALGILGGIVSIFVNGKLFTAEYAPALIVVTASSSAFLFFKTVIPPLRNNRPKQTQSRLSVLDESSLQKLYAFSIVLSILILFSLLITHSGLISLGGLWAGSGSVLLAGLFVYGLWRYSVRQRIRYEREEKLTEHQEGTGKIGIFSAITDHPQILGEDIIGINMPNTRSNYELIAHRKNNGIILIKILNKPPKMEFVEELRRDVINEGHHTSQDVEGLIISPKILGPARGLLYHTSEVNVITTNKVKRSGKLKEVLEIPLDKVASMIN